MNKRELKNYLGKFVEVILWDDCSYRGILRKLNKCQNVYCCVNNGDWNISFIRSQVKKVREL